MAMFLLGMGLETEMGEGGAETKGSPFIPLRDSKPSLCLKEKNKFVLFSLGYRLSLLHYKITSVYGGEGRAFPKH